jgi:presenilin-like A22 family membrane protease
MTASAPNAAGRLNVISGIRLACMPVSAFFDFAEAFAVISVPQTRHLVAFSLSRVPQVGQICDF